jgi:chromosomal replication initiator protein
VEAALSYRPGGTPPFACALEGRTMQPDCVVSVVPNPAQDESIREVLAGLIGQRQFEVWFRQKTRLVAEDDALVVYAASPFHQKWLQKQHRVSLAQAARTVLGASAHLRFEVDASLSAAAASPGTALIVKTAMPAVSPVRALRVTAPADASIAAVGRSGRRFADLGDFVIGPCNELALTAVRQVTERPDGTAGPLFIYGPVGMGKTHLLEGLYRDVRRKNPALQVLFLTSEQFTNHFTQACRDRTLPAFRQRFRTVDVLLVDDVDFLDAKRGIQEEFLHTWQQLERDRKLVVACGNRHPRLMTKISDEHTTRFLSGMVCRLEPPDLETREQIALCKARELAGDFSPEALKYAARKFSNNVRELEGALHCLKVYHRMTGQRVGISAARQVLADLERDCVRVVRMADIERVVCDVFGLESADLKSSRRARSVSEPRMLAMYLARRHTRAAYSEIGEFFGGRNHATVISADRKVGAWLAENAQVKVASQTWRLVDVVSTIEQQLLAG